jgi:hypothetical protein
MILIRSRGAVAVLVTEPDPAPAIICKNSMWPWLFFFGVSARMCGGAATDPAGAPPPNTTAPPDTAEWAAPCGADAVVSVALIAEICDAGLLVGRHGGCWSTKVWQQSGSSTTSAGKNLNLLPQWRSGECDARSSPSEDRARSWPQHGCRVDETSVRMDSVAKILSPIKDGWLHKVCRLLDLLAHLAFCR